MEIPPRLPKAVTPQVGIVDIVLGDEDRLGLTFRIKRLAFEVGDDLVEDDPGHPVRIFSDGGVLAPFADAIEGSWRAVHTDDRDVALLSDRDQLADLAQRR